MYRMTCQLIVLGAMLIPIAVASPDPELGEELLMENCFGCHDESIYTRPDRIINSYHRLTQRVRFCSVQQNLSWFEEEIEDVASYLNRAYYQFSP